MKTALWSLLILGMAFTFTSCEDGLLGEALGNDDDNESFFLLFSDEGEDYDDDFSDLFCFEFVYPLTATNPDGTTLTINDEDELETVIDNAISSEVIPMLNFPIQVLHDDENPVDIATEEELCELIEECWDDYDDDCDCDDDEECFEFNFPITIVLPDNSTVTVNDWDEFETALDNYYDANPNEEDEFTFVFPITVTMLDDNSIVTINDEDELEELFEECYGDLWDDCFEFQFPLTFTMFDGSILTGNSEEELDSLFDAWYVANPNDSIEPILNFPVTVVYDDGTTETVNDEDELDELFEECFGDDWDDCGKIGASNLVAETESTLVKRVVLKTSRVKKAISKKHSIISNK